MKVLVCAETPDFMCTADKCPDNCCKSWFIRVDEHEYEKLKGKFTDGAFGAELERILIKAEQKTQAENRPVYTFAANAKGTCMLVDENGLCKLHKAYGTDYLPFTCLIFPRGNNTYGGYYQEFLSLACPVAARMVLLKKNGIEFIINGEKDAEPAPGTVSPLGEDLCLGIRAVCMDILSAAGAPFDTKFAVIGAMLKDISDIRETAGAGADFFNKEARVILNAYRTGAGDFARLKETARGLSDSAPANPEARIGLSVIFNAMMLTNIRYIDGNISFQKALKKISYRYADLDAHSRHLAEKQSEMSAFFNDYDYVFCNYVKYAMFVTRFPYESLSLNDAYAYLAAEAAVLKHLLVCLYDIKGLPGEQDIIDSAARLSRKTRHSNGLPLFMPKFYEILKEQPPRFSTFARLCM